MLIQSPKSLTNSSPIIISYIPSLFFFSDPDFLVVTDRVGVGASLKVKTGAKLPVLLAPGASPSSFTQNKDSPNKTTCSTNSEKTFLGALEPPGDLLSYCTKP